MFVRAKTIKGKQYAYLVKNIWKKGKVKQTNNKYLGKIIDLDTLNKKQSLDFENFLIDFNEKTKQVIINIIKKQFYKFGFEDHKKQNAIFYEKIIINFSTTKITEDKKNIVLKINNRYFYSKTLRELLDFYEPESEEDVKGKKLAETLSNAGINISNEDFVQLYKKIYLQ